MPNRKESKQAKQGRKGGSESKGGMAAFQFQVTRCGLCPSGVLFVRPSGATKINKIEQVSSVWLSQGVILL